MLGVERFGASAPAEILLREYGLSVDNMVARARKLLASISGYHTQPNGEAPVATLLTAAAAR